MRLLRRRKAWRGDSSSSESMPLSSATPNVPNTLLPMRAAASFASGLCGMSCQFAVLLVMTGRMRELQPGQQMPNCLLSC